MIRPSLLVPAIAPMLLIAGCGGGTPAADQAPTNAANAAGPAPAEGYAERVRALPAGQRAGVFLRAVRDSGDACQDVTAEYEVAANDTGAAWAVTCDRTNHWVITFDRSDTAIVRKVSATSRLPPKAG